MTANRTRQAAYAKRRALQRAADIEQKVEELMARQLKKPEPPSIFTPPTPTPPSLNRRFRAATYRAIAQLFMWMAVGLAYFLRSLRPKDWPPPPPPT